MWIVTKGAKVLCKGGIFKIKPNLRDMVKYSSKQVATIRAIELGGIVDKIVTKDN